MRLLMWDPTRPEAGPVQLGEQDGGLSAVAVLNDGWVVTGGYTGDVLMWDPSRPEVGPFELDGHDHQVSAVAVLGNGRVVTGAYFDRQTVVWETADLTYSAEIACTAVALAASAPVDPHRTRLAIAHEEGGGRSGRSSR
jgi:hypothetical protein